MRIFLDKEEVEKIVLEYVENLGFSVCFNNKNQKICFLEEDQIDEISVCIVVDEELSTLKDKKNGG